MCRAFIILTTLQGEWITLFAIRIKYNKQGLLGITGYQQAGKLMLRDIGILKRD
jgi:hypothetical protein